MIQTIPHNANSPSKCTFGNRKVLKSDIMLQTVRLSCKYCGGQCKKAGIRSGNQQFQCKNCSKYQRMDYKYNAYKIDNQTICNFVSEGIGIRSTGRLLNINLGTVLNRIKKIAKNLKPDSNYNRGSEYEIDELKTYIKKEQRSVGNLCN